MSATAAETSDTVSPMRVLVVANPIAGRGIVKASVERLAEALGARGHEPVLAFTKRPGDAGRQAAEGSADADCIVAAGGDGTLREAFAAAGHLPTPIVPLALGTANMIARELGVPAEPDALVRLIESGSERRVDVGRVGDTCFLAVLGVGFDAIVTEAIGRGRGSSLGYRGYLGPILRAATRYRAPKLRVRIDGGKPLPCGFVVASNIRRYGGIMRLSPRARCDSGELEVVVMDPATVPHLLALGPFALSGTLHRAPGLTFHWGRRIVIESDESVPVQLDGDYWGTTPVDIELEPGAGRLLAPQPESRRIGE